MESDLDLEVLEATKSYSSIAGIAKSVGASLVRVEESILRGLNRGLLKVSLAHEIIGEIRTINLTDLQYQVLECIHKNAKVDISLELFEHILEILEYSYGLIAINYKSKEDIIGEYYVTDLGLAILNGE